MSKAPAKGQPKGTTPQPPAKSGFDPKAYAKNGVSEEEVNTVKAAFDLFDTDQGGSVDIKGKTNTIQNSRPP